jgi:hypothetical protein
MTSKARYRIPRRCEGFTFDSDRFVSGLLTSPIGGGMVARIDTVLGWFERVAFILVFKLTKYAVLRKNAAGTVRLGR